MVPRCVKALLCLGVAWTFIGSIPEANAAPAQAITVANAMAQTSIPGTTYLHGRRLATCSSQSCLEPAPGNTVSGTVSWFRTFSGVEQVCTKMWFRGNLVDPGEQVGISFDGGATSYGFVNNGSDSIAVRSLCFDSTYHPDVVGLFEDGSQNFTVFSGTCGSFRLVAARFTLLPAS